MTTTPEAPVEEPIATSCPRCGAVMRPDQDWCLMCGAAATTEVSGARGWKTPIFAVGAVLVIAAIALIVAFVQLSDNAGDVPQQAAATPTPAQTAQPTAAPTTTAPATSPTAVPSATPSPVAGTTPTPSGGGAIADWPAGKTAYTVIMWSATSHSEAERKATALQAAGAQNLGILHSDDYSSLRPGYWVVFSGQYGSDSDAQSAAQAAQAQSSGAYAKQVKPKA